MHIVRSALAAVPAGQELHAPSKDEVRPASHSSQRSLAEAVVPAGHTAGQAHDQTRVVSSDWSVGVRHVKLLFASAQMLANNSGTQSSAYFRVCQVAEEKRSCLPPHTSSAEARTAGQLDAMCWTAPCKVHTVHSGQAGSTCQRNASSCAPRQVDRTPAVLAKATRPCASPRTEISAGITH